MQPNSQQPPPAPAARPGTGANLHPDIVSNIPIRAPNSPLSPIDDDEDLDGLMRDVSKDLKKNDKKPAKKRFLGFKKKPKASNPPPVSAPAPAAQPATVKSKPEAKIKAPSQPSSVPFFTITVTIIVTGVLIAAAYYAYK